MALTKTKTKAHLRTMARTALLRRTAEEFVLCVGEYCPEDGKWLLKRLKPIIEHQLVSEISIMAIDGEDAITEVAFEFDWDEHTVLKNIKNEVDISELPDGETFVSTMEVIDVVRGYLAKVATSYPNAFFQLWIQHNSLARFTLGDEEFYRLLGVSPESAEPSTRRYKKLASSLIARQIRRTLFPDAQEASVRMR